MRAQCFATVSFHEFLTLLAGHIAPDQNGEGVVRVCATEIEIDRVALHLAGIRCAHIGGCAAEGDDLADVLLHRLRGGGTRVFLCEGGERKEDKKEGEEAHDGGVGWTR